MFLNFIFNEFETQKSRLAIWLPVMLGIGIIIYFSLKMEPSVYFSAGIIVFSGLVLAASFRLRDMEGWRFAIFLTASAIFWVCAGFAASQVRTNLLTSPVIKEKIGPVWVEGDIENIDRLNADGSARITLENLSIEKLAAEDTPKKLRIKFHETGEVRGGMRIKVLAGITPPSPPVYPGGFDFQRYCWFKRLGGFGFAYSKPEILSDDKEGLITLDSLRQIVARRVSEHVSWPDAAVISALMTGESSSIPEDDMEAMRISGLAHMLALSGMNVAIIAGCIFFSTRFLMALCQPLTLRYPIKKISAVLALLAITGYTFFVGANVPVFRALLMSGVVLIAIMLDRRAISMRLVALSAFAILLFMPESLIGASFQMSFSAVTALVLFFEVYRDKISLFYKSSGPIRKIFIYVIGICVTTVIATLATAPFSLYHFQKLALYGVLANLLASPIMSFIIMPAVILSYMTIPLGLGGWTLPVAGKGVEWMRWIAHWTADLEGSSLLVSQWSPVALFLLTYGIIFYLLWDGKLRMAGIIAAFMTVLVNHQYRAPDILASSSGKLVAYKRADSDDLNVSTKVHGRYDLENWIRMYGISPEEIRKWPREGEDKKTGMICGEEGCRVIFKKRKLAFPKENYAISEDCNWADIIISPIPIRDSQCNAGTIIDLYDIRKNGAYSLSLNKNNIEIKTVSFERGVRPWHSISSRR